MSSSPTDSTLAKLLNSTSFTQIQEPQKRPRGRPAGSKDTKPRKPRKPIVMDDNDDDDDDFDLLFRDNEAEEVTEAEAEAEEKEAHWPNIMGSSQNQPMPPLEPIHPHSLAQIPPNQQLSLIESQQMIAQLQAQLAEQKQQLEAKDQQIVELKDAPALVFVSMEVQPERVRQYEGYHQALNEILAWAYRLQEAVKENYNSAKDFGECETKEDIPESFQVTTLNKHIKRTETFGTYLQKEMENLPEYIESLMVKLEIIAARNHWDRVVTDKHKCNVEYAAELKETMEAEKKATKKRKDIKAKQKAGIKKVHA